MEQVNPLKAKGKLDLRSSLPKSLRHNHLHAPSYQFDPTLDSLILSGDDAQKTTDPLFLLQVSEGNALS